MQQPATNFQQPIAVPQQSGSNCAKPIFACVIGPLLLLGCLVGTACACVFVVARGNPDPLYEDYEPNQELADNYERSIINSINIAPQGGAFEISIQDEEFSSWLNIKGEELLDQIDVGNRRFNERARPSEYQVRFEDQEIQFYILFDLPLFDLAALITAEVSPSSDPTSDSIIELEVTGFKFGSLDILSAVEGEFETDLGDLFVDRFLNEIEETRGTRDVSITSINVDNGVMAIQGIIGQ